MKPPIKRIVLCADDFALNPAVSEAILALLAAGRLSVTSCMSDSPFWPEHGERLRQEGWQTRAGLHFNLTEPFPDIHTKSLSGLMLRSALRSLDVRALRDAVERQLDRYEVVIGIPPTFVDGHQHVHVFPQVRDVLMDTLHKRYKAVPRMRSLGCFVAPFPAAKAIALRAMGAELHANRLGARRIESNPAFGGLYGLSEGEDFPALMQQWLDASPDGGLLMCHPAKAASKGDAIGPARAAEYAWLASDAWPQALQAAGACLVEGPAPVESTQRPFVMP